MLLLTLLYCVLSAVTSSLIQHPTHSCYQEDVTFSCTADRPLNSDHLLNLAISVLHYPAIDSSRLIHSNLYTYPTQVNQNLTITSLSPTEAPASVVCISILWSNNSNNVISTQIESNSSIMVPSHPAAVSSIALQVLTPATFKLYIKHDGVVHREDLLSYVIELSTSLTQLTYPVSYSNLTGQIFTVTALFDICYKLEVNTSNCVGDTRYFSSTLFLPKLMNETLTRVSLTEFCWYNQAANTVCPGPYFIDFVQQNMFDFSLIQNDNVLENITYYVNLPTEFCIFVPEQYLILNPLYLRVYMEGIPLTTMNINIPVDDVVPTVAGNNLVIIIASASVGVIVLLVLSVFLLIFIVCLVTIVKRRRSF